MSLRKKISRKKNRAGQKGNAPKRENTISLDEMLDIIAPSDLEE